MVSTLIIAKCGAFAACAIFRQNLQGTDAILDKQSKDMSVC